MSLPISKGKLAAIIIACFLSGFLIGYAIPQFRGDQAVGLVEELKKLEEDLALRERKIRLLNETISELRSELKAREELIGKLNKTLAELTSELKEREEVVKGLKESLEKLRGSLRGRIDEVELLTLLSLDDTSVTREVYSITNFGHNYTIDLREVRGNTTLLLTIDGRTFVGKSMNGTIVPEVIYSKPLPPTMNVLLKGEKFTFRLGVKHLLIWVRGNETKESISIRVEIAAIPLKLYQKVRKAVGWPPPPLELRKVFSEAELIFDKRFKFP